MAMFYAEGIIKQMGNWPTKRQELFCGGACPGDYKTIFIQDLVRALCYGV